MDVSLRGVPAPRGCETRGQARRPKAVKEAGDVVMPVIMPKLRHAMVIDKALSHQSRPRDLIGNRSRNGQGVDRVLGRRRADEPGGGVRLEEGM